MECVAKLQLNSNEVTRAEEYKGEIIERQQQEDGIQVEIQFPSVTKAINFLRTIRDLRDYSNEELEEYYIRAVE